MILLARNLAPCTFLHDEFVNVWGQRDSHFPKIMLWPVVSDGLIFSPCSRISVFHQTPLNCRRNRGRTENRSLDFLLLWPLCPRLAWSPVRLPSQSVPLTFFA